MPNGMKVYDLNNSERENSLMHDLQQISLPHHDKSFNEQLDEKAKFILNQESNANHHNLSIGAIVPGHGSTVR